MNDRKDMASILRRGYKNYLKYLNNGGGSTAENSDEPSRQETAPAGSNVWGELIDTPPDTGPAGEESNISYRDAAIEGVEMSYREQIEAVTMAEILISQGRIDEAKKFLGRLAKYKGMTPWVEKRLKRLLEN